MIENNRKRHEYLRAQLELERSSFLPLWRELGDFILPRRTRFFISDANKGDRRNQKIIDSTATLAARTLRSGMMGGITSPARPWFKLSTADPDLAEFSAVKDWLYVVGQRMHTVFLKSNIYQVLPICYGDLGVFATAPISLEEDFTDVIRSYSFPVGSYMIANNYRLKVDVFFREFRMTVRQLISRFGRKDDESGKIDWSVFSEYVKNAYDRGDLEKWVDVCHVIQPNEKFDSSKVHSKYKRYLSCYYEKGTASGQQSNYMGDLDRYLSQKGYDYFPILCPRWEISGEDVYGTSSPGIDAIGDIKQLQIGERRGAQAIDKMINPPMVAPVSLKTSRASILPGDITFTDERDGQKGFRPAHEINFRLTELENKQQQVRGRVDQSFYKDLFLMMANDSRSGITATEVAERKEEKLLALGPVLEQLNQDLLDPLIDNTFAIMLRQGLIPKPPKELQGMPLQVEYISVMAQAQKLVGISGVDRFAGFASQVGQVHPESLDKVDADKMLEVYGDMTSIPPGIIRTDDQVQAIRDQRSKQQQAQAQAQMVQQGANTAKTLSQTDTSGSNALTQMIEAAQAGNLAGGP